MEIPADDAALVVALELTFLTLLGFNFDLFKQFMLNICKVVMLNPCRVNVCIYSLIKLKLIRAFLRTIRHVLTVVLILYSIIVHIFVIHISFGYLTVEFY